MCKWLAEEDTEGLVCAPRVLTSFSQHVGEGAPVMIRVAIPWAEEAELVDKWLDRWLALLEPEGSRRIFCIWLDDQVVSCSRSPRAVKGPEHALITALPYTGGRLACSQLLGIGQGRRVIVTRKPYRRKNQESRTKSHRTEQHSTSTERQTGDDPMAVSVLCKGLCAGGPVLKLGTGCG